MADGGQPLFSPFGPVKSFYEQEAAEGTELIWRQGQCAALSGRHSAASLPVIKRIRRFNFGLVMLFPVFKMTANQVAEP